MTKKKEDRSDWVAVAPEFSSTSTTITPAITAYQFYQRQNTASIRSSLVGPSGTVDVGTLTKEVSSRWRALSDAERRPYEELAQEDMIRFRSESHARDVEAMERKERLQRERETLVIEGEGGRTRKERRRGEKRSSGKKKKKKKNKEKKKAKKDDDDDSDYKEENDHDDSSYQSEESSESDEYASDSNSSASSVKKQKAKRPPSAATLARRRQAKEAKEEKEAYIAQRQSSVRGERAEQAKRRLEFLLKQSDIFSHFGNVKAEKARLGLTISASNAGKKDTNEGDKKDGPQIVRQPSKSETDNEEEQQIDREEADEHEATYLTSQPSTLGDGKGKMRQYQLEGLNWMIRLQENGVNGILADEMGLGKTMQSISILVYMMEFKADNGPHLIIVPKSTLSNWMNELARWAPKLTAVKFHGTKEERVDIIDNILQPGQRDEKRTWNVCVTTYEICNLERNIFNKFAWSYLVIDEAHRLKNEASTFSRVVRTLETRFRLLLTGTPLQNNLHELWALLNFLVPDVFASAEQFDEWFNLDIDDADEKNKLISQLHKILRPFMLRRLKADVEKSLPPKTETILFTGMSAMQKKLYKDILMRDLDTLTGKSAMGGGGGSRTAVLNIVMQLRKCAGHPYLFPGVEDRSLPPLGEHLVENCGKMVLLDKLLVRLKERGHRVLLFTQMTRILDILEDYMHMRGFQYCRIDGNTSYEEREERIDAYNAPESEKFLFLLSTRAGGLGINLQTADVVILYDSDWNPQADLQAQDRAHRIGQKREVQVFRLVTEDTIEQKVVERAQQKLKLDAMVVQQGRLKDKDKLSREELLDAVRFGADKIFKSKESSITDDDIDLILGYGKKKTQELNDKLQAAQKGDMLDFKLDGGLSAQTYQGVDYSEEAKNAQFQAEILGIIDVGKRERRTVAYNENKLYLQQVAQQGAPPPKKKVTKEIQLPKMLRLPRIEEWQMFDQTALYALQDIEEQAFRALPQEVQAIAGGVKRSSPADENKESTDSQPAPTDSQPANDSAASDDVSKMDTDDKPADASDSAKEREPDVKSLPPLLSEEQKLEKRRLLAEGFSDWNRYHYSSFVKASAKYGRHNYAKIALDVGKPLSAVKTYSEAFWDSDFGKKRFSEHEYERVVKLIEKGERKIEDIKGLQRGTKLLISLFENPWVELQFTHVNTKDKKFTPDEDRFLLCAAEKYGYGQWEAIKFALRRSSAFRFDYFLKSLPPETIGRRCEQLMRAAEKEVEAMEKQLVEEAEREGRTLAPDEIKLPMFNDLQAKKRADAEGKFAEERLSLENNLADIERQIRQVQKALHDLDGTQPTKSFQPAAERTRPSETSKKRKNSDLACEEPKEGGAMGPDGFVAFPEYDGKEEPHENKKAFTLFCKATRKEVKNSLSSSERKNKDHINSILKDRWYDLSADEKDTWKQWEVWDAKRYEHQLNIYENQSKSKNTNTANNEGDTMLHVPKRSALSIPKKNK